MLSWAYNDRFVESTLFDLYFDLYDLQIKVKVTF